MTTTAAAPFETVIGLEVHAQSLTRSKMFCSCSIPSLESPPNTHVCPVCLGMPGVLPVINREAVELTIMTGLALNCEIPAEAKFDRKNYHYPDLMKGYQISEYDLPFCKNGWLEIEVEGATKRIGITRVHLEEDTAKSSHVINQAGETYSLVDVNRSGLPLMEIVSRARRPLGRGSAGLPAEAAPDPALHRRQPRQHGRRQHALRAKREHTAARFRGVRSEGGAEEHQQLQARLRRHQVRREAPGRSTRIGGRVVQETRGWREDTNQSVSQRTKEYADDYRYFPEPDLPTLVLTPELGGARPRPHAGATGRQAPALRRAVRALGLRHAHPRGEPRTGRLLRADSGGFAAATTQARAKTVANWMNGDFARLLNATKHRHRGCKGHSGGPGGTDRP